MPIATFKIKTPAKINLFLNIRGQRPDGYHELCMVMQAIALFDELTIAPNLDAASRGDIRVTLEPNDLGRLLGKTSARDNLLVRAYRAFWEAIKLPPLGLHVHLNKQIPVQAGLGGGSSDAAAMLLALNHLSHAHLSLEELQRIGASVGSDVPFFLTGGTALVAGRGEQIQPLAIANPYSASHPSLAWLIVKPRDLGISTQAAYQAVREASAYRQMTPEYLLLALQKSSQSQSGSNNLAHYLQNDFESVLFPQYPALEAMANQLRDLGVERPLLSGSGPSMAGLLALNPASQKAVTSVFPPDRFQVFWTHPHLSGPVQV